MHQVDVTHLTSNKWKVDNGDWDQYQVPLLEVNDLNVQDLHKWKTALVADFILHGALEKQVSTLSDYLFLYLRRVLTF